MSSAQDMLEEVLETIRSGNVPGPDAMVRVEETLRAQGGQLSKAELHGLLGLVTQVQDALLAEQQAVGAELDRLASEKKAIRGYAQLRSRRTAQRVNRKT